MQVLKRSRKEPQEGDIFVYRILDRPYGFGRVIRKGTRIGGFTDVILLYIYDAFSPDKLAIPRLDRNRLLIEPVGTNRRPWTMGFFETVRRAPLTKNDILPVHCFWDATTDSYRNEFGKKLARKYHPCGLDALGSYQTIDAQISLALGIEPAPDEDD